MKKKKSKSKPLAPSEKLVFTKHPDGCLVAGPLPKHYWRDRKKVPSWSLEAHCRQAYDQGLIAASKLARIADYRAVPIPFAARQEEWLEEQGLDIVDMDPLTINEAQHILDKANAAFRERIKEAGGTWNGVGKHIPAETYPEEISKPKRGKLFGHPITAVIRVMGVERFDFDMAKKALKVLGADVAENTIKTQLRWGKSGTEPPAELSEDEIEQLWKAIE